MPHPPPTPYAVRRASSSEHGRWVICENGRPNAVIRSGYLTKWGAVQAASRWKRSDEAAHRMYPV